MTPASRARLPALAVAYAPAPCSAETNFLNAEEFHCAQYASMGAEPTTDAERESERGGYDAGQGGIASGRRRTGVHILYRSRMSKQGKLP